MAFFARCTRAFLKSAAVAVSFFVSFKACEAVRMSFYGVKPVEPIKAVLSRFNLCLHTGID